MKDRNKRKGEIKKTIQEAMTALNQKKRIEWGRDDLAVSAWQEVLDGVVTDYVDGKATLPEVKKAYKAWVGLLEVKGTTNG